MSGKKKENKSCFFVYVVVLRWCCAKVVLCLGFIVLCSVCMMLCRVMKCQYVEVSSDVMT